MQTSRWGEILSRTQKARDALADTESRHAFLKSLGKGMWNLGEKIEKKTQGKRKHRPGSWRRFALIFVGFVLFIAILNGISLFILPSDNNTKTAQAAAPANNNTPPPEHTFTGICKYEPSTWVKVLSLGIATIDALKTKCATYPGFVEPQHPTIFPVDNIPALTFETSDNQPPTDNEVLQYVTFVCKQPVKTGDDALPFCGGWAFPCPADIHGKLQLDVLNKDWLSGDASLKQAESTAKRNPTQGIVATDTQDPGHLEYTYFNDTIDNGSVISLFKDMEGLAFVIVGPVLVLVGYQIMVAASGFRYGSALESLSRLIISVIAIVISYSMINMMIGLADVGSAAIIALHQLHPFPTDAQISGYHIGYSLDGDSAVSYRGLVMPITQWGCAGNDFASILSDQFITDTVASIVPIFGNFIKLAGTIKNVIDLAHHLGELIRAILSISLTVQVVMRIILLNFYIVTAPTAFACWALPGGVGQNVIQQWFKGFGSVLFTQVIQLFVLTAAPLLIPALPNIPFDSFNILNTIIPQLPVIFVLIMALRIPNVLGTSATKAITTAGTMAGGTVAAVGMALHSMV